MNGNHYFTKQRTFDNLCVPNEIYRSLYNNSRSTATEESLENYVVSLDYDKTSVQVIAVNSSVWFPHWTNVKFILQFLCKDKTKTWNASTFVNFVFKAE